jgi:4-hydroxythreonine-4-phosphate dehydrogenase
MDDHPAIAVTVGEPAGIGPELLAMLGERHRRDPFAARLVFVGDRDLLIKRAALAGFAVQYRDFRPGLPGRTDGTIEIWHQPIGAPVTPGRPDPSNAFCVLDMLAHAADGCATGAFAALVTAPVQKSVLQDAGIRFTGHTEYLAERTGTARVVMMLTGGSGQGALRVALVTTHIALAAVPAAITIPAVVETLCIVHAELRAKWGIARPRIAVCGLNPHAGEAGYLGHEEIDVIAPAIAAAGAAGYPCSGPFPADTVFVPAFAQRFDAIVAMYHDQGLPALKAATFGHGVNVTLGLPYIRTSVDHGTALDLAGDPAKARAADPGSLIAAVELAIELAAQAAAR